MGPKRPGYRPLFPREGLIRQVPDHQPEARPPRSVERAPRGAALDFSRYYNIGFWADQWEGLIFRLAFSVSRSAWSQANTLLLNVCVCALTVRDSVIM